VEAILAAASTAADWTDALLLVRPIDPTGNNQKSVQPRAQQYSAFTVGQPPKPMRIERPRIMQRRVPSLPTMPWQDDGRQHQHRSCLMMLSRAMADLAADANAFRQGSLATLSANVTAHGTP
jgi:hypothetical protein